MFQKIKAALEHEAGGEFVRDLFAAGAGHVYVVYEHVFNGLDSVV